MRAEYEEKITGWEAEIQSKRDLIVTLSHRSNDDAAAAVPSAPPNKPSKTLPAGWKAARDPDSGDTYYVSDAGETSWDFPGTDIVI